jgi:AcrR family transcriptional regulator
VPSTTRQRLTEAAAKRFYRDGFRNVGLDQILTEVGISKTAFYKHFDSKEDLVLAVLKSRDQWLRETLRAAVDNRSDASPVEQLKALFDVGDQIIGMDEFQGCIFVNVVMEFPRAHEPEHIAAAQHKEAIEGFVYELALRAGAENPHQLARALCLIMEGAYVTRQVTRSAHSSEVARQVADLVIAAHVTAAKP